MFKPKIPGGTVFTLEHGIAINEKKTFLYTDNGQKELEEHIYKSDWSSSNTVCTYVINLESKDGKTVIPFDHGLTPYGRTRARVCAGGYNGCQGDIKWTNDCGEKFCDACAYVMKNKNEHVYLIKD